MTIEQLNKQLKESMNNLLNDKAKMAQIRKEAIIEVWGSEKAYSDAKAVLAIFEKYLTMQ